MVIMFQVPKWGHILKLVHMEAYCHTFSCHCSASHILACSSFQEEELSFKWIINNTTPVLRHSHKKIQSPSFTIPKIANKLFLSASLYLLTFIDPSSPSNIPTSECSIYLSLRGEDKKSVGQDVNVLALKLSFCVMNSLSVVHACKTIQNKMFIEYGKLQDFDETIKISEDELEQCLHNDALTIEIHATLIFLSNPIESVSQFSIASEVNTNQWMKLMLNEELFTDIMIKTNTKTFKVHRAVLASHSDVFKRMFYINMQEKHQGLMTISDIEPEVMTELLAYMYTGSAPNLKTFAKELLLAADKYNIPHLQVICENELKLNLTSVNVTEILLLADELQLKSSTHESLKEVCTKFIKHNPSVYQLDSWKKLKEISLELAVETMENIVNSE